MNRPWWHWEGGTLILELHVQPRASRDEVAGVHGERLKIRLTAPPVGGRANTQLVRFLAGSFRVPTTAVSIESGASGRDKRVAIRAPRSIPPWLPA